MDKDTINLLIREAKEIANKNFCCKYTKYTVGVALLTKTGKVYKGFNVENDGIQSMCAERVAFAKALSEMNKDFLCIAVVGKKMEDDKFIKTVPCGYCRQFITEYTDDDFMIYTYDDNEEKLYSYTIKELLPENFDL